MTFAQSIFEKANPSRQGSRVSQPSLLKLPLKPYQLASVSWMANVEEHTDRHGRDDDGEWHCSHVMKCQSIRSSMLFDVIDKRILLETLSPDSHLGNFTVRVKGGILAGTMTCPFF